MKKTNRKRLELVARQVDTMPFARGVEDVAFERFCETGELPEHQRLAHAVVIRAVKGGRAFHIPSGDRVTAILERMIAMSKGQEVEPEPERFREILFNEAVNGPSFVRGPARLALKILVSMGRDVTDPEFIPLDTEIPDWGSVGWHLLGFPERIAKPPYEEQARRLFDRFADLRARIDRDDQQWFERLAAAGFRFLHEGELPDDELLREAVLANAEFFGLLAHYVGQGDPEVMAAFDAVARSARAYRAAAIARVRAIAAEGRLLSTDARA